MDFDVIKSSTHISKWEKSPGAVSMRFEVVPKDREYLEIGDDYILCSAGYLPMRDEKRRPIGATVSVTTNPDHISHVGGEGPICGFAKFFPERRGRLDSDPAALEINVVIEPQAFEEMLRTQPCEPGAASLYVSIEGLEYGWEPDGSHKIWSLTDDADCGDPKRRRVTSFAYTVPTFWTSEGEVRRAGESRFNAELADSPDPEDRKLAAATAPPPAKEDPLPHLLRQCRTLLLAILGLGVVALVMLSR